jgi:prepilin-type N-terminal cleavage/methylation domain-containing protein
MVGMRNKSGFTIVELLIVIVVIAILAAISVAAYTGVQDKTRNSKISADLAQLSKAIQLARLNSGEQALRFITNSTGTAGNCMSKPAGTDLATLDPATDSCWISYRNSLQAISTAANMDVTKLLDPWGRPYVLDENEKEGASVPCGAGKDYIGVFKRPLTGGWGSDNVVQIPYITPGC